MGKNDDKPVSDKRVRKTEKKLAKTLEQAFGKPGRGQGGQR